MHQREVDASSEHLVNDRRPLPPFGQDTASMMHTYDSDNVCFSRAFRDHMWIWPRRSLVPQVRSQTWLVGAIRRDDLSYLSEFLRVP